MKDETLFPDEQLAFEKFMEDNFCDLIDRRHVKNGDGGYFAWDMVVAWIVWQGRAALQSGNSVQPVTVPDGYVLVPVEPTITILDEIDAIFDFGAEDSKDAWHRLLAAAPTAPDGWIPVSERMPDKLIPVMVMYEDGDMWSAIWSGQFWDDGCAIPDPHSITHWRDMPDAPQGV